MDVVGKIENHTKQISFMWIINDFCNIRKQYVPGQAVLSPTFYTDINCKWQLKLWPQGSTEVDNEFISLYIYYLSKSTVKADITFSVIDGKAAENTVGMDSCKLFDEGKGWGVSDYFDADQICEIVFVARNKLIIKCKIELHGNTCLKMQRNEKEIDLRIKEYEGFEKLLTNYNKFSDVILSVGDEKFHAHKCILAMKSSVFAAMFEHDLVEKQCNVVEIEDVEPDVLKEMLRYMYVGRVNDIADIADDLLIAADKYLIENLKNLCEEFLCNDLSFSTVFEYLDIAENHNAAKLKAEAIQYIVSNAEQIIDDSHFHSYADLQSNLICDIFRKLVVQQIKSL